MINHANATTDFYRPEVFKRLQSVGCHIRKSNRYYREEGILCSNDNDEEFLSGNHLWLTKMCKDYRIPLTEVSPPPNRK